MSLVIPLSSRVQTSSGPGTVRFVGPTSFAAGKWVGVELDSNTGKNDGSVAGKRYFNCDPGRGVFVRDRMVQIIEEDEGQGNFEGTRAETPVQPAEETFKTPPLPASSSRPSSSTATARRPSSSASVTSATTGRPLSRTALNSRPSSSVSSSMPPPPAPGPSSARRPSSTLSSTDTRSNSPVKRPSSRPSLAIGGPRQSTSSNVSSVSSSPRPSSSTSISRGIPPPSPSTSRLASSSRTSIVPPTPSPRSTPLKKPTSSSSSIPPPPNFAPKTPTASNSSKTNETPKASRLVRPTPTTGGLKTSNPTSAGMGRTLSAGSGTSTSSSRSGTSSISRIGGGTLTPGSGLRRPGSATAGNLSRTRTPAAGEGRRGTLGVAGQGSSKGSLASREDEALEASYGSDEGEPEEKEQAQEAQRDRMTSPFKRPESTLSTTSSSFGYSASTGGGEGEEPQDPLSLKGQDSRKLAQEAVVSKREYDSLFTRLQILERRRNEDREKLRDLERLKDEEGEWEKLREKIKGRLEVVAAEGKELKRDNKELKIELESLQTKLEDVQEEIEHSLLDKEIAESELEEEKAKVKGLEERVGELEVEVGVFREENARLEGPPDEEGTAEGSGSGGVSSLAYRQIEKQNLRLKDALLRLRDLTTENELESKKKIEALEKELDLSSDLQGDLDNMAVELEESEAKVEELKAQLDAASEAQDMLEELTDRNMKLQDDNDELKLEIEELEALRELADELEESHVETEKQLQEELDLKDLLIQDLKKRNDSLEDSCVDYERTISQFRDAVVSLQSDLEDLRRQQSTQASESQSLSSQSQAMLNLNLKLKTSVLKSQVKAIDLELRKLEARQASEHLAMVKPYLLPAFFESDADAVDSLLFFERLAYKADLVSNSIEQNMPVNEALDGIVPEDFVGICETRAKLGHYSSINKRFAAHLKRCPPDVFLKMGRVYRELAPNEKKLDGFVELLRKEELKVLDCGKEIDGLIAQSEHLAETHLSGLDPTLDLAEREVSCISILDLDYDIIAAAAGFTKQTIATLARDPDIEMEVGDANIDDFLFKPLQNLVNHARNAKVLTKKLLRRFDDLASTSSALNLDHAEGFDTLAYNSTAIAQAVSKLASDVLAYCTEVRSSKQPLQIETLASIAREIAAVELGKQSARPLEEINALLVQLSTDVGTTLSTSMEAEHVVQLSYSPPWEARVAEIQSNAAINVDAERKVVQLNEEMRELARELRTKEQSFQESTVKIELMEKRLESVKKQADVLAQLESELAKSRKQERTYEEANEVLQRDLDNMEQELGKLRQNVASAEKQNGTTSGNTQGDSSAYEGNLETAYLVDRIHSLRSTIRFLRSENSYLKSQDLLAELDSLPSYELPPTPPLTPEPPSTSDDEELSAPPLSLVAARSTRSTLPAQSFAIRSKQLLREARLISATPQLVDLSQVSRVNSTDTRERSARRDPKQQLWAEKERVRNLERKMRNLVEAR
ncbi:uncharacterized protein JCM6883_006062 [Sporobolomyces salmoneus]|uniref:uncharacterized protein n=1 Tax=Sporobolomyces salmoneus TaxID=183962 RepID=UPI003172B71E